MKCAELNVVVVFFYLTQGKVSKFNIKKEMSNAAKTWLVDLCLNKDICSCGQTPLGRNPVCKRGHMRGRQANEDKERIGYKQ